MTSVIATKVLPNIWIGNSRSAEYEIFFEKENIKSVLNISTSIPHFFTYDTTIEYMRIPVSSRVNLHQIYQYFPIAIEYIYKNSVLEGKNILVHCDTSTQRSCIIIAAYLLKYYGMTIDESINFIVEKKADAFENYNIFYEYLQKFYHDKIK